MNIAQDLREAGRRPISWNGGFCPSRARLIFQWPISTSEGAGSARILVLVSGAHLVNQALGKTHVSTAAAVPATYRRPKIKRPAKAGPDLFRDGTSQRLRISIVRADFASAVTRTGTGTEERIGRPPRGPSSFSAICITAMAN